MEVRKSFSNQAFQVAGWRKNLRDSTLSIGDPRAVKKFEG